MSIRHIAGLMRDMIVSAVKPVSGFRRIFYYISPFLKKTGMPPSRGGETFTYIRMDDINAR